MRKINLILLIAALFIANISVAQNDSNTTSSSSMNSNDYQKIRIGIYGDFGFSYLKPKSNDFMSEGIRGSYSYGLVVDNNFTKNYTFSTGIRFSSYGGKLQFKDTVPSNGTMMRSYRVNYLEIPLNLKLKTNEMGYFKPFVQVGLNNGFRLSAYSDNEFRSVGSTSAVVTENNDISSETTFYRLSLEVGIGTEFSISQSLSAFALLSFQNGLTNSMKADHYDYSESRATKESAMFKKFALTVGLLF